MREPFPTRFSGWGRYPVLPGRSVQSESLPEITGGAAISRGLGRAYGDAALPAAANDIVASSTLADRLLNFDSTTGVLRAEAGLSLLELNRLFLPRGWFTPVTPGTQFVTLGGMVAADVHGKNHHWAGSFGQHLLSLRLRLGTGEMVDCSESRDPDLFRATIGGMGLTGHILEVEFRMERIPSPWIWSETERLSCLDEMIAGLKAASREWSFSSGWIDSLAKGRHLGRGLLFKGRWAESTQAHSTRPPFRRGFRVPFEFPNWILTPWSMSLFNAAVYWRHPRRISRRVVHPQTFFYPLDRIERWNLVYGRDGLAQYQCVVPHAADNGPTRRLLELAVSLKVPSFLTVVKDFGAEGKGWISFPKPGITVTFDLPLRSGTAAVVARFNELVAAEGGRVYLAKDPFTTAAEMRRMDPRLESWLEARKRWDPRGRLRSAMSIRVMGDPQ